MAKYKLSKPHVVEEMEAQFHKLQKKINKARVDYLASHEEEIATARQQLKSLQAKLDKAGAKAAKKAVEAKKRGGKSARNQLKKARAASLLLGESLKEAKNILVTAESRLHAAKPFDRKLAARAKVLEKFERDWEKKMQAEKAARSAKKKKPASPALPVPVTPAPKTGNP